MHTVLLKFVFHQKTSLQGEIIQYPNSKLPWFWAIIQDTTSFAHREMWYVLGLQDCFQRVRSNQVLQCVCGRGGRGGEGWELLNGMALIITNSVLGMYRYTITVLLTLIVCCYCLLPINGCYLIASESPSELSRVIARLQ